MIMTLDGSLTPMEQEWLGRKGKINMQMPGSPHVGGPAALFPAPEATRPGMSSAMVATAAPAHEGAGPDFRGGARP